MSKSFWRLSTAVTFLLVDVLYKNRVVASTAQPSGTTNPIMVKLWA